MSGSLGRRRLPSDAGLTADDFASTPIGPLAQPRTCKRARPDVPWADLMTSSTSREGYAFVIEGSTTIIGKVKFRGASGRGAYPRNYGRR